jgi:beta-phosphoglucomutase
LPRTIIANKILQKHNRHLLTNEIKVITEEKNKLFLHLIEHSLTPKNITNGISQLIDDAISRGLQLVAISSSANAVYEMKCLGLYDKFLYVSSYDKIKSKNLSKEEKQAISPLLYALKTLGIKPDECIGLEDSIDGIIEYKRLGIFAIAIANYHEDIKREGDY